MPNPERAPSPPGRPAARLNPPVQGTGADILTRALGVLYQGLKGTGDFRDARGEATLIVTTLRGIDGTVELDWRAAWPTCSAFEANFTGPISAMRHTSDRERVPDGR